MSMSLMCSHHASAIACNLIVGGFWTLLGDQPGADVGPLISPQAKERVCSLIQSGVDEGAKLLLDGRNVHVKGYENGNFVGPTIISGVTVREIRIYPVFFPNTITKKRNTERPPFSALAASDEVLH